MRVTPYAGVWIEIFSVESISDVSSVTPYAGVWIEICGELRISADTWSLPTRECGLKYFPLNLYQMYHLSLPTRECGLKYAENCEYPRIHGHSLRGSVD